MRHRFPASTGVLAVAIAMVALASMPVAAQAPKAGARPAPTTPAAKPWTPPKTAWGDPDLQGIYTSDDYIGVGLQRNTQFGDRLYLTDQEIAQRETQLKTQAANDLQETVNPNARVGTGPPGHWGERAKRPPKQTSLIVDPPNGRLPETTAEAKTRKVGIGAGENDPKADSWEDFTYYIRCITRGVAGSILPVIFGNGNQTLPGPGYGPLMHGIGAQRPFISPDRRAHLGLDSRTCTVSSCC